VAVRAAGLLEAGLTLSVTAMHTSILVAKSASGMPRPPGLLKSNWRLMKAVTKRTVAVIRREDVEDSVETDYLPYYGPYIPENIRDSFFWIGIYAIGIIVGFVGLFSLVSKSWNDPRIQTFTFVWIALVAMSVPLACLILNISSFRASLPLYFVASSISTGVTGALYSDWVVAAIASNYGGVPDGNNLVLYWIYFSAKRLQLLSF
jgi:hypothetical protein